MKAGFTVVEVVVSMAILSVLLLVVTMLYLFGLRASEKTYREMDQLATLQAAAALLGGDLEPGAAKGISCTASGDILSILSASDGQQTVVLDGAGHVVWQKYVIYAYQSASQELRRYEYRLPTGTVFSDGPMPLESWSGQPLTSFVGGSQPSRLLATHVLSFQTEKVSFRLVHARLVIKQSNKPEQSVDCTWRVHN